MKRMLQLRKTHSRDMHASCSSPSNGVLGGCAVGRRLALVQRGMDSREQHQRGTVIAYYPKTGKHRVQFDHEEQKQHEENESKTNSNDNTTTTSATKATTNLLLLESIDVNFYWLPPLDTEFGYGTSKAQQSPAVILSDLELAVQQDAVGRRLELFHEVRKTWCQGTVFKYIEPCHQHSIEMDITIPEDFVDNDDGSDDSSSSDSESGDNNNNKHVRLVDLADVKWRYIDLRGPLTCGICDSVPKRDVQDLVTSKYMGVVRISALAWRCFYRDVGPTTISNDNNKRAAARSRTKERQLQILRDHEGREHYIGCFSSEKDAALAYDLWARRDDAHVNFADRMICKSVVEHLKISEPQSHAVEATAAEQAEPALRSVSISSSTEDNKAKEQSLRNPMERLLAATVLLGKESTLTTAELVFSSSDESRTEKKQKAKKRPAPLPGRGKRVPENIFYSTSDDEGDLLKTARSTRGKPPSRYVSNQGDQDAIPARKKKTSAKKRASDRRARALKKEADDDASGAPRARKQKSKKIKKQSRGRKSALPTDYTVPSSGDEFDSPPTKKPKSTATKAKKAITKRSRGRKTVFPEDDSSSDEESVAPRVQKRKSKKMSSKTTTAKTSPKTTPFTKLVKYPVGTHFIKTFPDFGSFRGRITAYDGRHYQVYYSADEDEEELSEFEFDDFDIISEAEATAASMKRGGGSGNKKRRKQRR